MKTYVVRKIRPIKVDLIWNSPGPYDPHDHYPKISNTKTTVCTCHNYIWDDRDIEYVSRRGRFSRTCPIWRGGQIQP